ncbi:bifunctional diguanylate cyclase/phosphodiesterase [Ideonella sp. A 288]|uniref:putative bifunctional diguanylate cyclase/phosphodiesterase n=1 Tax=Ideonella sp. A 288 TaxID=1962181 RepID=UPI0013034A75|nr:bifunctional diguanylate cyclase/phosphodiesterase [Ideonella sp. A 288]
MDPFPNSTGFDPDSRRSDISCRGACDARSPGMLVVDAAGRILQASPPLEALFGYGCGALGGRRTACLLPRRFRRRHLEAVAGPFEPGDDRRWGASEGLFGRRRDGTEFPIDVHVVHLQLGGTTLACAMVRDRTACDTALDALFSELERTRVTLNSIGDAVLSTDINGHVVFLNPVSERLTGYSCAQARGRPVTEVFSLIDATTRATRADPVAASMRQDRKLCLPPGTVLVRQDGSEIAIEDSTAPIHNRRGHVDGAVVVFRDVTAARAQAAALVHSAGHDTLTGLPNRTLLNDRLDHAIDMAARRHGQLAVLFLDLDAFKHINDSMGHTVGDELLQSVALRLKASVRLSDTVSRQGGDEFVVLLSEITSAQSAGRSADKIVKALAVPHIVRGQPLTVSVSVGISLYPEDGTTSEKLLQYADLAMYQAKQMGRNTHCFFEHELNNRAVERQSVESELRRALEMHELVLHYQPKFDLASGQVNGVEALIRWLHPTRGLLGPEQFLSVAEDCGLIVPMGRWVLEQACRQARVWLDDGVPFGHVAVNVCALEFRRNDFLQGIATTLSEAGLPARHLELELTEGVLMSDTAASVATLHSLSAMGVSIAVDDFGTGYSSLSYLRRFPIDVLKIDKTFVQDLGTGTGDSAIVHAIIGLGASLSYRVIAEGVETAEQLALLNAQHCGEGQGFLFSRPLTADALAALLRTSRPEAVMRT